MYTVVCDKCCNIALNLSRNLDWLFQVPVTTFVSGFGTIMSGNQMKRLFQAALTSVLLALPVYGNDRPVVVELFTSQGCSSCPPADEMMQVLAERDDVIPLSVHVDYWDYIGWKDDFAEPHNAERQRGYAMAAGRRSVYTPEIIVNGMSDIVGAKPMKLAMAIDKHKNDPVQVSLILSRSGERVRIDAEALQAGIGPVSVQMLRYQPLRVARISRGENAGRTIHYVNVTHDWQSLGIWKGDAPLQMEADAPGEWPVVVILQGADYGPILAAAQLP